MIVQLYVNKQFTTDIKERLRETGRGERERKVYRLRDRLREREGRGTHTWTGEWVVRERDTEKDENTYTDIHTEKQTNQEKMSGRNKENERRAQR